MIVLHDITQRKETESVLSRRESIMSAISLAAGKFLMESTWEHHIPGVLESIGQAASVSRVYVFMNDMNEQDARQTSRCYEWVAPGISPQIHDPAWQHTSLAEAGLKRWDDQLSHGQALHGLVRDFPDSERFLLDAQDTLSLAIVPIFVENQWWGFIGFDDCVQERHWSATELEGMHILANIFGSAETRARTEQKLLRKQMTLGLFHEIVLVALRAEDLQSMAQDLVGRLAELIGADGSFISLWNEAGRQTLPLAAYGPHSTDFLSRPRAPGEHTFAESAVEIGHPVIVDDIKNSPHIDREYAEKFAFRSVLLLPLIAGRKKLGAIVLSFDAPHVFQPEEISVSEQAAGLIALAFEKFQVIEDVKHRAHVSETLRKAGMAVSETLETNEAMTLILQQLKQVVDYDSASIQLLDGNEVEIVAGSGYEDPSKIIGVRFPIPGDNPNSIVINTGKPYTLSDAGREHASFNLPPHDHIRSWLGVPLIVQDTIIGLLSIDSAKLHHFTKDSQNIAREFADQVAIVLKNTRLLEETRMLAIVDPLTGLYNRRGLLELGKIEFGRSNRLARPFSGIMLDLDHFKEVNDSFGHDAGDRVLEEVARRCKKCLREIDLIGRYGGEEFVALLPETDFESSLVVAERLRTAISATPIQITDVFVLNITASLGVAHKDENTPNLETLIARADQAMYIAKHRGRDRVARST